MSFSHDLQKRLIEKYGRVVNLEQNPGVITAIYNDALQAMQVGEGRQAAPFGISWMDSWVAHWIYEENFRAASARDKELATLLRALVDIRFGERLDELRRFVTDRLGSSEPPDAGPPEPGTPLAGPSAAFGPDAGPPEPGTPPAGPIPVFEEGLQRENPWILYWFVSIKAPMLLDVIDAHFSKRLDELSAKIDREK